MVSSDSSVHHVAMPRKTETRPATGHINPFGLRMQADLRERLETAATMAGRSLNAEITKRLSESFSAISSDEIVARAEDSDVVELIALQKVMSEAFMAQQAYLTNKIFDLLDAQGALEKYKDDESTSWLKLSPPKPGEEFSDALFSVEVARQKTTDEIERPKRPKRKAR